MTKTIKVSCNGAGHHVNEVDLGKILKPAIVTRSAPAKPQEIPERSVLRCQFCREGKVVVTREMIEDAGK
jgi:hypothetical protein